MAANETTMTMMESAWGETAVYILAVLICIFMVVAAIGNLLVMVSIIATRKDCDRGYIFIFNLSFVDFCTATLVMPISLVTLLNGDFILSDLACDLNGFSVQVVFITSIQTLMFMSAYRYMSISQPFTPIHLWKIAAMIIASWAIAFVVSSLSLGVLSEFEYKPYTTQCGPSYPTEYKGYINSAIVSGFCFIIPLIVIICVYILIFRKAHKLFTRLEDPSYSNYSHEAHTEQRRLSITFIMIVIGFLICWCPIFVYLNYASLVKDKESIPTLINPIVYWFGFLNSAINPFIYGLRTPIFKQLLEKMCKTDQEEKPPRSLYTSCQSSNNDLSKQTLPTVDVESVKVDADNSL